MTQQDDITQRVLTDDEIRAVWVEHGLDDEAVEDFARAIETALLSKLRAPVADERAAVQHHIDMVKAYGDQLYCKASASNPTDKKSWSKSAETVLSNVAESYRAALASAPVAGYIKPDPAAPTHPRYVSELKYRSAADAEADPEGKGWLKVYAAPQASAETDWHAVAIEAQAERDAAREERDAALRASQQRAGDVVEVCPDCDIAGCQHIRASAALSATQAEQGGRD